MEKITQNEIEQMVSFISNINQKESNREVVASNLAKIQNYIDLIDAQDQATKEILVIETARKKLVILRRQLQANYSFSRADDNIIINDNICECVINLIEKGGLNTTLLIARVAYRELAKYLYYNASYICASTDEERTKIVTDPIDCASTKIFTYLVCSQWAELYTYILGNLGVNATIKTLGFHRWVEIELDDKYIIKADAADYINKRIDFATCKYGSATVGFYIFPKAYAGKSYAQLFTGYSSEEETKQLREIINSNNDLLLDIDKTLEYATNSGYATDLIVANNEIFNDERTIIPPNEVRSYMEKTINFFQNINIPPNVNGYELYSYYYEFKRHLPRNIFESISLNSIYVSTSEYCPPTIRPTYLQVPPEYSDYLFEKFKDDYQRYLAAKGHNKVVYENIRKGILSEKDLRDAKLLSDINKVIVRLVDLRYYVINQLTVNDFLGAGFADYYQLFEPFTGKIEFNNDQDLDEYKKKKKIRNAR